MSIRDDFLTTLKGGSYFGFIVYPSDYRLFQVADLVCSLKLLKLKMESHELAKNELLFFEQERVLNRKYLKVLEDKEKLS